MASSNFLTAGARYRRCLILLLLPDIGKVESFCKAIILCTENKFYDTLALETDDIQQSSVDRNEVHNKY